MRIGGQVLQFSLRFMHDGKGDENVAFYGSLLKDASIICVTCGNDFLLQIKKSTASEEYCTMQVILKPIQISNQFLCANIFKILHIHETMNLHRKMYTFRLACHINIIKVLCTKICTRITTTDYFNKTMYYTAAVVCFSNLFIFFTACSWFSGNKL